MNAIESNINAILVPETWYMVVCCCSLLCVCATAVYEYTAG